MLNGRAKEPRSIQGSFGDRLTAAWSRTDEIFDVVASNRLLEQPIVWRHPIIFYLGHLPAFAWNQICAGVFRRQSFHPAFDEIFARGIDPDVDTGACHDHPQVPAQWPAAAEVFEYRDRVRASVLECCGNAREFASRREVPRVFSLVLEHELMHQEALLYMLQELAVEIKGRPRGLPSYRFDEESASRRVEVHAGPALLGADPAALEFGWDNEFGAASVEVAAFHVDSLPVTNGRFLEFIECGGYDNRSLWTPSEWAWKVRSGLRHPPAWSKRGNEWRYRTMFDVLPLQEVLSWPVYVSLAEARAYARWSGSRLLSEAEFHRAAYTAPDGYAPRMQAETVRAENLDFANWSAVPATPRFSEANPWGIYQLVGNGWEWTDTPFAPFDGFQPLDVYPEYSADFFDGKHFVLKGASWATASSLVRPSFRNWYQAHYPYVFAKFRCVSSVDPPSTPHRKSL
ncbi:MAG TPA: SUMF1/EgtB/PvdO family nonheme iron enzyme [Candidatus Eisenbacteria bacterium]|nr:SUMF1/EgtB/PvdO family nonheme iron enzyme [Candidatus Eisenbacteria bacterium]